MVYSEFYWKRFHLRVFRNHEKKECFILVLSYFGIPVWSGNWTQNPFRLSRSINLIRRGYFCKLTKILWLVNVLKEFVVYLQTLIKSSYTITNKTLYYIFNLLILHQSRNSIKKTSWIMTQCQYISTVVKCLATNHEGEGSYR